MRKEIKNISHSVHDRLRQQGRDTHRPFNWMLISYANERFLYRLSKSKYSEDFVLKGGLIFIGWGIPLRRHTRDIDFRSYTSNELENIIQIIKDVCVEPVETDGIVFEPETVKAEIIQEAVDYVGVRATLLNMPAPQLLGYPKETVVAEKIHSLVRWGRMTSRKKDFYDLWYISKQYNFNGDILSEAIQNTFKKRNTEIPDDVPEALSSEYASNNQAEWLVLHSLRAFLLPPLYAAAKSKQLASNWNAHNSAWCQE
jgi:predicted nucleotidyltransferase component of viral defense system